MRHIYTFKSDKKDKKYKAPFYSEITLFYFRTEGIKNSSLVVPVFSRTVKTVKIEKTISYLKNDTYKIVDKYPTTIYGFLAFLVYWFNHTVDARKPHFRNKYISSRWVVV